MVRTVSKEQVKSIQDQTYQISILIRMMVRRNGTQVEIIQELMAQDKRIRFCNQGAIKISVLSSFQRALKYSVFTLFQAMQDDV